MKNPHIIVGDQRRCICGCYEMLWQNPPNTSVPVGCGEVLAALERLVKTGNEDAFLLDRIIQPLVRDCDESNDAHQPTRRTNAS